MPLHFDEAEFAGRQDRAAAAVRAAGLDALLMFAPESHYWISGYDTFGYALFQCMVLTGAGDLHLLTRTPDLRQAQVTSTLPDDHIHIWRDGADADPADDLARLLAALGIGGRIGVESDTAGLTDRNGQRLRARVTGLVEASDLIRTLRRLKSPAEIALHRRAAELSDDALDAALAETRPGAFEGDILAAMQGAVFRGGGDYAGNEFVLGSGARALLCRSTSGRRHLDARDQLTLEWSGTAARYHAAMMRTILVGGVSDRHRRMHAACEEALLACEAAIRPGEAMGSVYAAHARVFDAHGYGDARLLACGYGMGAVYPPIWVDFPMFHEDNPLPMAAGQVVFLHMILMDSAAGAAMTLGTRCWWAKPGSSGSPGTGPGCSPSDRLRTPTGRGSSAPAGHVRRRPLRGSGSASPERRPGVRPRSPGRAPAGRARKGPGGGAQGRCQRPGSGRSGSARSSSGPPRSLIRR